MNLLKLNLVAKKLQNKGKQNVEQDLWLSGIEIDITESFVTVTKINHTLNPNYVAL